MCGGAFAPPLYFPIIFYIYLYIINVNKDPRILSKSFGCGSEFVVLFL